jgi:acyl-coenzyme A thioesterase PaaI-like protein
VNLDDRRALADRVRAAVEAAVLTDADAATVKKAVGLLDEATALLSSGQREGEFTPDVTEVFTPHVFSPWSPIVGYGNPLAPPVETTVGDGVATGRVTFGWAYQGPPALVHGAVIAGVYDDILGFANMGAGVPAMTGTLTVRYRKPTPLHREVVFEARVERIEGRKVFTSGQSTVDGVVTSEADGIFIQRRR